LDIVADDVVPGYLAVDVGAAPLERLRSWISRWHMQHLALDD
jgi:hypothetical protein